MNTKLLMSLSAIVMGLTGIILTFFPQEIAVLFQNGRCEYYSITGSGRTLFWLCHAELGRKGEFDRWNI